MFRPVPTVCWTTTLTSSHCYKLANLGQTVDNMGAAIDGETYEIEEMCPAFTTVAE
jgi:rubrerythrin